MTKPEPGKPGPSHAFQLVENHDLSEFRRPMQPIPARVQTAIERGVSEGQVSTFDDPNQLLNVSGSGDGLTDDVVRLPNGQLIVACLTEMPGVTLPELHDRFGQD